MKRFYSKGFTLLELIILIVVMGVVTAIGIPSFKSMLVTSDVVAATNDLMISMKRTRSEAITRGRDVTICSSTDGQTCSGVAGDWASGWLVFVDLNDSGNVDEAAGELLWVNELDSKSQLTITPTDTSFDTKVEYSYTGGIANGVSGGFHICSGYAVNGFPRREITVSGSGDISFYKNTAVKC